MKKRKGIILYSVIAVAVVALAVTIVIVNSDNTIPEEEILEVFEPESYLIPLDATEEELKNYALGDIFESELSDGQTELGILDSWEGQLEGKPLTLDIEVGNARDVFIACSFYTIIDSIDVMNAKGKTIASSDMIENSGLMFIEHVPAGAYTVVVNRYQDEEAFVVVRAYSQLTTPALDLPNLTDSENLTVSNPYDAELVIINKDGEEVSIAPMGEAAVQLSQGANDLKYFLREGNLVSTTEEASIIANIFGPEITILRIRDDMRFNVEYVIEFEISHPLKRLVINGKSVIFINPEKFCPFTWSYDVPSEGTPEIVVFELTDLTGKKSREEIIIADYEIAHWEDKTYE